MTENEVLNEPLTEDVEAPLDEGAEDDRTDTEIDERSENADENRGEDTPDYEEIAKSDLRELKAAFPELKNLFDITELKNPVRYAELRDLGLSAEEAYLATARRGSTYDTRAHLTPTVPGGASVMREMSRNDYDMARELFSELSDAEIRKLYRKVTK